MKNNFISILFLSALIPATGLAKDLEFVTQPKPPSPNLKIKASKVPQFELVQKKKSANGKIETIRVTEIPKLNIGEEAVIKANSLKAGPLPAIPGQPQVAPLKKQGMITTLEIDQILKKLNETPVVKDLTGQLRIKHPVIPKASVEYTIPVNFQKPAIRPTEPKLVAIKAFSQGELKMLMGIILEEKVQQYALALGLFAELKRDPVFKLEATYHLATTARNLGLYSEFKTDMASLIESGKEPWAQMALNNLVKFSGPGDSDIVAVLDNQLKAMKTPPQASDQFRINQARYYIDTGELSEASDALKLINDQSKVFAESLFLRSLIEYRSNKIEQAINLQKQALDLLWLNSKDSELRSVSALTLARMYFQIGKYKETFEAFLKVDKKHPEWLQAMIEQAWSQVLAQDYEGAAGNMFSLHTEFLKKQFTPESYVVRTVAYLNLCQFGDGAMVVKELQRKYAPFFEQIKKYKESKATPEGYYDTVRAWAKDPMQPIVNGIPGQLVYAMTKHPGFLTHQNAINALEDEATTINQISLNLVKNERALIKKISDTKLVLADAKAGSPEINRLKTNLGSYQAQFQISKTARQNIKPVREELLARVDILKAKNKKKAGMALQTNFNRIFTTLQNTLDQIDVLRYELYSGAGEHIRYQLAGGDVNDKQRPELKVEDSKALNWEFKGEVWEDEIGHYRSSLKNVCPPEEGGSQPGQ